MIITCSLGMKFERTGEIRLPLKGEYYIIEESSRAGIVVGKTSFDNTPNIDKPREILIFISGDNITQEYVFTFSNGEK